MQKPRTGELIFFWIVLGAVGVFAFGIMSPYLTPLFLACVFTVLFAPIHRALHRLLRGRDGLAALVTVLVVLVLILIPLIFLGVLLFDEVRSIYDSLSTGNVYVARIDQAIESLSQTLHRIAPTFEFHANVSLYLETALRWMGAHLNTFFTGMLSFIFQIFITIIAMFFLYRDGKQLHAFALKWSPLNDEYDDNIILKIEMAIASVVQGALLTAIVQGIMVGIGFSVVGIPNPVLFGVVATVAALIPMMGTGIVTLPGVVWLISMGQVGPGIALLVWGLLCVGLIDNILSPYLMKRGMGVHPFLILLSVFGGLTYFGPIGFLAGPIILAFFFTLLEIYPQIVKGRVDRAPLS